MTVWIRSNSRYAAGPTDFTDSLLSPDQPFSLGNDWFDVFSSSATVNTNESLLGGNINRGATGVSFGTAAMVARTKFFPIPIDHREVRRIAQITGLYAAWTHVLTGGAASCDVGVMVFGEGNRGGEYCLNRAISGQVTLYQNLSDGAGPAGTLISNVFTIGVGDEYEIRAVPKVGSNDVYCIKNGVTIAIYNDAGASRPIGGLYGIHYFGNGGGGTSQIYRNFRGGVLAA